MSTSDKNITNVMADFLELELNKICEALTGDKDRVFVFSHLTKLESDNFMYTPTTNALNDIKQSKIIISIYTVTTNLFDVPSRLLMDAVFPLGILCNTKDEQLVKNIMYTFTEKYNNKFIRRDIDYNGSVKDSKISFELNYPEIEGVNVVNSTFCRIMTTSIISEIISDGWLGQELHYELVYDIENDLKIDIVQFNTFGDSIEASVVQSQKKNDYETKSAIRTTTWSSSFTILFDNREEFHIKLLKAIQNPDVFPLDNVLKYNITYPDNDKLERYVVITSINSSTSLSSGIALTLTLENAWA